MRAVVTHSGGLDSTVLLYHLMNEGWIVSSLSVDYGQRHRKELVAAANIARYLGIEHRIAELHSIKGLLAGSSQTSDDIQVPEGHYTDESMKQTVVPNRNMILLSLAGAWALSLGKREGSKTLAVAYAAHAGDHAIYPDCRPEFAEAVSNALKLCDWTEVRLLRPFLYPKPMTKANIVSLGAELNVPFHLTWSCYKGGEFHCGRCGTCVERREAFLDAGVGDPTRYVTDHVKES